MPTTYAIPNGRTVMGVSLYTGTGASQTIVNSDNGTVGFKPDLVWDKVRSTAGDPRLIDSVRGVNLTLESDNTGAEFSESSVTAFNSNGFTGGTAIGASGQTFVAWQWQAGQGVTSSNTSGSITSTVSVNPTAGFSVVTFTGVAASNNNVGHGLGVSPSMIILKSRGISELWTVYFPSLLTSTQYLELDSTAAVATGPATTVTSSTMTFASGRCSATTYVAYCWSEVAGFSKFGSYTGNGSADGPFVYTGFRPRYVMVKCSSAIEGWYIWDTARDTYNSTKLILQAQASTGELGTSVDTYAIDVLSNGFKLRQANVGNQSSQTMIYMAFAENPFKYANAR